jgi:hypothetical protein
MSLLYNRVQPEAGPSRLAFNTPRGPWSPLHPRQDGQSQAGASSSPASTIASDAFNSTVPAASTPTDLFPVTSLISNATSTYTPTTVPSSSSDRNASSSYTATSSSYYTASSRSAPFSRPWEPSTRSASSHAAQSTPYVSGVIVKMVLGGDDDDQAVYSVPMDFGHGALGGSRRKRRPSSSWDGGSPQTVNLQVDLGSSDMVCESSVSSKGYSRQWVASTECTNSDCDSAPALFNASLSLDANTDMEFKYQMGEVSGDVYWEQVQLGGFGIGYQAFREHAIAVGHFSCSRVVAADEVTNEDLTGGNFTGVLGLARE